MEETGSLSRVWGRGRSYTGFWLVERSGQLPSTQAGLWPLRGELPEASWVDSCRGWGLGCSGSSESGWWSLIGFSERGILHVPSQGDGTAGESRSPPLYLQAWLGEGAWQEGDWSWWGVLEGLSVKVGCPCPAKGAGEFWDVFFLE